MPLFSIIAVHYQPSVAHETFLRGIASIQSQTFADYELLVYHDGPLTRPDLAMPVPVRATEKRFNDWGHSLRDMGIREATGEYIVHFNADNVLYASALETIAREIARPSRMFRQSDKVAVDTNNIIIFPVIMHDTQRFMGENLRLPAGSGCYMIMTGNPPAVGLIDCMQLVMKRELWLAEGGWRDKREAGDAFMYPEFAAKYGYRAVGPILAEHF